MGRVKCHAGIVRTGLLGIWLQWTCLVAAVIPTLAAQLVGLPTGMAGIRVLVLGIAASRFGLWMFDLAVTQLIQEEVAPDVLGMAELALLFFVWEASASVNCCSTQKCWLDSVPCLQATRHCATFM